MNILLPALSKKTSYTFIVRFLACFIVIYNIFPLYRGIVGPGGAIYIPFVDHYLNLVKGLTLLLTKSSHAILEVMGYNAFQKNYHSLKIVGAQGISVNPSCLGWGVMSFWISFIYANYGSVSHKARWIIGGLISIILLNISRIVLIVLASHYKWIVITSLDYHQSFNIASYLCIFVLTAGYIRAQKKYDIEFEGEEKYHAVGAI